MRTPNEMARALDLCVNSVGVGACYFAKREIGLHKSHSSQNWLLHIEIVLC